MKTDNQYKFDKYDYLNIFITFIIDDITDTWLNISYPITNFKLNFANNLVSDLISLIKFLIIFLILYAVTLKIKKKINKN